MEASAQYTHTYINGYVSRKQFFKDVNKPLVIPILEFY